ncbi:MAG: class I SAM-dependent methyltransferase, partial [Armatimonadetes bacterium]|nr:class I SAM-dependent methyltransferase [Armatimonadota bacterium]
VRCRICGLVFTNPRLPVSALHDSYEEDYGEVHEDPVLLVQRRVMYEIEREELKRWTAGRMISGPSNGHGRGRLLDVGCGTGEFLALLREDFEVYGLEVSQRYLRLARERYGLPHLVAGELTAAGFEPAFFDVVQMRGVLQHLPDPLGQLREACRVTKPGGLLVVSATPNIASPAARVFGPNFRLLAPDQMVYNFSPWTLRRMVETAGYRVERFTFPYVHTPYFRWWQPLEFVGAAAKLAWRRMAGRGTEDLKSPAFWGSMMTCIARKAEGQG